MYSKLLLSSLLVFSIATVNGHWDWAAGTSASYAEGRFYGTAPTCAGKCTQDFPELWFSGLKSGDGAFCLSGSKVYCNTFQSPYQNYVWRGTAPFCGADCNDCYPALCVAINNAGDGGECLSGDKVLCAVYRPPQDEQADEQAEEEAEYKIKLNYTSIIEIGFVFKYNLEQESAEFVSLMQSDEFLYNLMGGIQHYIDPDTDFIPMSYARRLLSNKFLIDVKAELDSVEKALEMSSYLEMNGEELSKYLHNLLIGIFPQFKDIDIVYVESNVETKYVLM